MGLCPHCKRMIWDPPRTTGPRSESACLNGWLQVIASHTGHDFDEVKVMVKARAVKRGFPPPHEVMVGEESVTVFKSEARCSHTEIMALIEETKQLAGELEVTLPEYPKEKA